MYERLNTPPELQGYECVRRSVVNMELLLEQKNQDTSKDEMMRNTA
jgi:hypothetical protein